VEAVGKDVSGLLDDAVRCGVHVDESTVDRPLSQELPFAHVGLEVADPGSGGRDLAAGLRTARGGAGGAPPGCARRSSSWFSSSGSAPGERPTFSLPSVLRMSRRRGRPWSLRCGMGPARWVGLVLCRTTPRRPLGGENHSRVAQTLDTVPWAGLRIGSVSPVVGGSPVARG
jgi:hypothetical protein